MSEDVPQNLGKRIDWGNAPQWVSALCALALALLAIWGLFFSEASQALVSYLQSELAVRNQRIAALEVRERELQSSISQAQNSLDSLTNQKSDLEGQISVLKSEQQALAERVKDLGSSLSSTEFFLVREKISTQANSVLSELDMLTITLPDGLTEPQGVRPQTVRPWDMYLRKVREHARKLPIGDQALTNKVLDQFVQQCGRYSSVAIQIPALRIPKGADLSVYGYDRSKHPAAIRLDALSKEIQKAEDEIETCFKTVVP